MTTKLTGDEPYYPTPVAVEGMNVKHSDQTGITIKQKFIADWMFSRATAYNVTPNPMSLAERAEEAFQAYLKIINGE